MFFFLPSHPIVQCVVWFYFHSKYSDTGFTLVDWTKLFFPTFILWFYPQLFALGLPGFFLSSPLINNTSPTASSLVRDRSSNVFTTNSIIEISSSNCEKIVLQESRFEPFLAWFLSPFSLFSHSPHDKLAACLTASLLLLSLPATIFYSFDSVQSHPLSSHRMGFLIHLPVVHMVFRSPSDKYYIESS